jgi:hypothetical protein
METITRNVRDISSDERKVLEQVLGRQLGENQQVIIQVVTPETKKEDRKAGASPGKLPDWCNVYEGLADVEISEIEKIIQQRADLTRLSE